MKFQNRKIAILILLILAGCVGTEKQKTVTGPDGLKVGVESSEARERRETEKIKGETAGSKVLDVRVVNLFNEALVLMENYPHDAILKFKEVIDIEPNNWEAYYNMGIISIGINELGQAEKELKTALKFNAPASRVYTALGNLYLAGAEDGKMQNAAIRSFKKALENKKSLAAMVNVANIYLSKGSDDEAAQIYLEAEKLYPESRIIHYNKGVLLYKKGAFEKANDEFNKAIGAEGRDKVILFYQGQCLFKIGDFKDSLKKFRTITEMDPADPRPYVNMGIIYEIFLGDMKNAMESYSEYIEKGGEKSKMVNSWLEVVKSRRKDGGF